MQTRSRKSVRSLAVDHSIGQAATRAVWLLICAVAVGGPPTGYYDSVDDSSPSVLRATLHDVIDDHVKFPYSATGETDTWDILEAADEDPNNSQNVLTIYRNRSQLKSDHWDSGNTSGWNREHSWPSSYGFAQSRDGCNYPYTDCHHLFAANGDYNEARSNLLFNWVPSPDEEYPVDNEPYSNFCWNCDAFQDGDWEVWPGRRGDIARAMFYMDVRYEGDVNGNDGCTEHQLILTNDRNQIDWNANRNFSPAYMAFLDTLIEWHNQDPPDTKEMGRNDVVFSYQGNRNPFIDHPEWVDCLYLGVCSGGGSCGSNADCDDANACTTDICLTDGTCAHDPADCDDGDPCTSDSCDSATGQCVHQGTSPCCGNGACESGEDQCSCSADCGTPPFTESTCDNGLDDDCDGQTDCADADCDGNAACSCLGLDEPCSSGSDCCSGKCNGPPGGRTCR